jgi:hypothetical protein
MRVTGGSASTLTFGCSKIQGGQPTEADNSECEIVLRHEDVDRRSREILARYRIPTDRSPDLTAMKASPAANSTTDATAEVTAEVTTDEPSAHSTSAASE